MDRPQGPQLFLSNAEISAGLCPTDLRSFTTRPLPFPPPPPARCCPGERLEGISGCSLALVPWGGHGLLFQGEAWAGNAREFARLVCLSGAAPSVAQSWLLVGGEQTLQMA